MGLAGLGPRQRLCFRMSLCRRRALTQTRFLLRGQWLGRVGACRRAGSAARNRGVSGRCGARGLRLCGWCGRCLHCGRLRRGRRAGLRRDRSAAGGLGRCGLLCRSCLHRRRRRPRCGCLWRRGGRGHGRGRGRGRGRLGVSRRSERQQAERGRGQQDGARRFARSGAIRFEARCMAGRMWIRAVRNGRSFASVQNQPTLSCRHHAVFNSSRRRMVVSSSQLPGTFRYGRLARGRSIAHVEATFDTTRHPLRQSAGQA